MLHRTCLLALLAVVLFPSRSSAQVSGQSFASLSDRLKPGDTVFVTRGSDETKGKVVDVRPTSLVLSVSGQVRTIDSTSVTRMERQRSAARKGALVGLIAGAVLGAFTNDGDSLAPGESRAALKAQWVGVWGGLGAGTGAIAGALFRHRETLFDASRAESAALSVSPIVTGTRRGVALSVGF